MKAKEAVLKVLQEAGEPLHFKEITHRAIQKGFWQTKGKTPELTIYNCINEDIRREKEESPFFKKEPSVFGLHS